jgi:hypothetical protein
MINIRRLLLRSANLTTGERLGLLSKARIYGQAATEKVSPLVVEPEDLR